ncbi:phage/plasmid primase, P4 family [Halomonas sp. CKK8]|uniref:DNA primase family protein n=1 Tax=Halomonas sp. CKK8 TaxID=3036127 RepID=UPI0024155C85|nr:phage/plasmid primase, P4 family [Halomonas sp. CKK8]WFM71823.1 phage/plasmid primase, P4 family [Halomonas sp. CKK8]
MTQLDKATKYAKIELAESHRKNAAAETGEISAKSHANKTAPVAELTEVGNAERFVSQQGGDVRYVPEWGWMAWTGSHWAMDELRVRRLMMETVRRIHSEAAKIHDKAEQKKVGDWAVKSQQSSSIKGALWCAQPALAAKVDDFDSEPMLLPVLNGTVDLRTGDLHEHRREHMLTKMAPVYFDTSATCPTWEAFLERVLPDYDVRVFVQRLVGYSLTGSTSEQILAFLYGGGRNGKSVFIETLASLMGDFHSATRIETVSMTRGAGIPNDVAALAGSRMVTVSETPEGSRLNESLVKDLTGGDTISARFLRHEFFAFRPQFKLWIRGNHKPQIRGTDDGIWRRILLVPFTVQIPAKDVDPKLAEKLRDELPGILAWAVRGCIEWQRIGLCPPNSVKTAVDEYRAEMDTLGEFITDCCLTRVGAQAKAKDLYAGYQAWCGSNGYSPVSAKLFGTSLSGRGYPKKRTSSGNAYQGIGLAAKVCQRCDGEGCGYCQP